MTNLHSFMVKIAAALAGLALAAACLSPAVAVASATSQALRPLPAQAVCNWNHPGVDPFMGDVVAAVDHYVDIPVAVRTRLKERMARRDYDELVSIRRDQIVGDHGHLYGSTISDMHFGNGQVCHTVLRDAWTPAMLERGLVYCESGHCILVPTVCRNVSRIARRGVAGEQAAAEEVPAAALPPADVVPAVEAAPGGIATGPSGTAAPLGIDAGTPSFAAAAAPAGPLGWLAFAVPSTGAVNATGAHTAAVDELTSAASAPAAANSVQPTLVVAVPEPSTWASMAAGLIGMAIVCRRRAARRCDLARHGIVRRGP